MSRQGIICRVCGALALAALCLPMPAGAAGPADALPLQQMLQGLLGGLALFLFGMSQMSDALKAAAGDRMKHLLERVTTRRLTAAVAGAATTAIIQSSSITTVLVVGFVSAGLMTVGQSVGIIIGANVGTTMTAQIVAFQVKEAALFMIALGFALTAISRRDRLRQTGNVIMGLGLVFFGMVLMSDGMAPLRGYQPFVDLMSEMESPLPAIVVAAVFTAMVQSSSATTGIVITMASGGLITLDAGIALIFGANIGTCVTALLASLGKDRVALRTAIIHVLFNVGGVLLWLPFISQLAAMVQVLTAAEMGPSAAADVPRQIANAHTLFNLVNAALFLPLANWMVRVAAWIVPERPAPKPHVARPRFIDPQFLSTPALALHAGRQELERIAGMAQESFRMAVDALLTAGGDPRAAIHPGLVDLRGLHRALLAYLSQLGRSDLTEEESQRLARQVAVSHNIALMADIIEFDLLPAIRNLGTSRLSEATAGRGGALAGTVSTALSDLREVIREPQSGRAEAVRQLKPIIDGTVADALQAETAWLAGLDHPATDVEVSQMQAELAAIEAIKRIYTQTRRAAREIVAEGLE